MIARLHELEARQEVLQERLSRRPAPTAPLVHPGMAKLYRHQVERLTTLLESPDTRIEAMDAIRSLIEAIVLTPEARELRIDLQGDLAAILALSSGDTQKPATVSRDGLEQVKLVAGAGFEPATFRL